MFNWLCYSLAVALSTFTSSPAPPLLLYKYQNSIDLVFSKQRIITRRSTSTEPYITAILTGAQTELDLSGTKPFTLIIALTLRAKAPILCYIGEDDTFFFPWLALHDIGVRFRDHETKQRISSSHLDICRLADFGSRPDRPLAKESRLYLSSNEPVIFKVSFTGHKDKGCGRSFSPSFYLATCAFKAGRFYEATLPADRKISWWRWANFWEAEVQGQGTSAIKSMLRSIIESGVLWWTGDKERLQGVPVLPENEQLPIYIGGDRIVFSCFGERMEWPPRIEEEEKQFAEERGEIRERRRRVQAEASNALKAE